MNSLLKKHLYELNVCEQHRAFKPQHRDTTSFTTLSSWNVPGAIFRVFANLPLILNNDEAAKKIDMPGFDLWKGWRKRSA